MKIIDVDLEKFVDAYIECALWSSTGDDGSPLDDDYGTDDIHPESLAQMREDCQAFLSDNRDAIGPALHFGGHDFWLTRNRHGAGFWDGDWSEPYASDLTKAAHAFGECNLYVGDDGLIHVA